MKGLNNTGKLNCILIVVAIVLAIYAYIIIPNITFTTPHFQTYKTENVTIYVNGTEESKGENIYFIKNEIKNDSYIGERYYFSIIERDFQAEFIIECKNGNLIRIEDMKEFYDGFSRSYKTIVVFECETQSVFYDNCTPNECNEKYNVTGFECEEWSRRISINETITCKGMNENNTEEEIWENLENCNKIWMKLDNKCVKSRLLCNGTPDYCNEVMK